jgi:hypothetical protein
VKPRLQVVPQAPAPAREKVRQRLKALPKPPATLECRCGGREVIEVKAGVLLVNGKPRGGTKQLVCAACWMRGERVVLA